VIEVTELMLASKELISTTFQLPLYLAAAGVHWVLSYSFEQVQRWTERRFAFPR